jgi:hypothetical protein
MTEGSEGAASLYDKDAEHVEVYVVAEFGT